MSSPTVTSSERPNTEESGPVVLHVLSNPELAEIADSDSARPASRNSASTSSRTPPPLVKRAHSKRNIHMRSQSHNKIPVRLSTSANMSKPHLSRSKSTDGIPRAGRPGIKRNNRSYSKMTALQPLTKTLLNSLLNRMIGLHPLTKTVSNGSLKQHTLRKTILNGSTKVHLPKTLLDQSIRSTKSASSLKAMGSTSSMASGTTGIKTSAKRGRVILKLNEDTADDDYEDLSGSESGKSQKGERIEAISNSMLQRLFQPHEDDAETREGRGFTVGNDEKNETGERIENGERVENRERTENGERAEIQSTEHSESREDTQSSIDESTHEPAPPALNPSTLARLSMEPDVVQKTNFISGSSSPEDLNKNLYGGSMLLSQSTGLTRKIETGENIGYVSEESDLSKMAENLSGIVFNTRNDDRRRDQVSGASYQPNQSIFSNLQRTNTQFLSSRKQTSQKPETPKIDANSKDFSLFLASNSAESHSHDTRTQQRLWLQRENSLMDVSHDQVSNLPNLSSLSLNKLMFAHNYNTSTTNMRQGAHAPVLSAENVSPRPSASPENSHSVTNLLYLVQSGHQSVQSRIEFERLNREYVNVRRHVNPVAESLSRIEQYLSKTLVVKKRSTRSANSFMEFAPKWEQKLEDAGNMVGRLWLEALLASSSSSVSLQLYKQEMHNQSQAQGQAQNATQSIHNQHYSLQTPSQQVLVGLQGLTNQMFQNLHSQNQGQKYIQQEQLRAYRNRTAAPTTRAVKMAQAAGTPKGQK